MCLYSRSRFCKVAQEPIECYKTFEYKAETGNLYAWYMGTSYGSIYTINNQLLKANSFLDDILEKSLLSAALTLYDVTEGIHTYINYCDAYSVGEIHGKYAEFARTYKCIIPKGAKYYEGVHSDLCSDMLIVKELVK